MGTKTKNYNQTVNYLYGLQRHGIKLGLENPGQLMNILGEPQKSFQSIHIAGTNGKGSTAAMIASLLKECGFKVGLYTSPHLVNFTERIRINGIPISESDVIRLTAYMRKAIGRINITPTFFEFVTAMAFYYFACEKIDWGVIEVGMGGRLDATNVLLPDVSVITNISLDHTEFLGKNIPAVTFEKVGIIKAGIPVVTAVTEPVALEIVEGLAKFLGSDTHLYGRDFEGEITSIDSKHIEFNYKGYKNYDNLSVLLPGRHQLYNASSAIRVCEILMQKGLPVREEAINSGLSNLDFEGRFEWVSQTPPIILDSAHNPEAARALADAVKEFFPEASKRIILIIGIMRDKDIKGIFEPLRHISREIILTQPQGERAASPEDSMRDLSGFTGAVKITKTVAEAIGAAKTLWQEGDVILVTGSFYTTGEAKEVLGQGSFSLLRE